MQSLIYCVFRTVLTSVVCTHSELSIIFECIIQFSIRRAASPGHRRIRFDSVAQLLNVYAALIVQEIVNPAAFKLSKTIK